jgi:hypothetical protein
VRSEQNESRKLIYKNIQVTHKLQQNKIKTSIVETRHRLSISSSPLSHLARWHSSQHED